jgi:hypothetical protein
METSRSSTRLRAWVGTQAPILSSLDADGRAGTCMGLGSRYAKLYMRKIQPGIGCRHMISKSVRQLISTIPCRA